MDKLHKIMGKKSPTKGMFGIEVEVEGIDLPREPHSNWGLDFGEGSLRDGGLEYVFKHPLDYAPSLIELKRLKKYIADEGGVPKFTPRTSVHVHVNVTDLTYNQMCNFLFLSFLVEGNLSHFCGDSRKGNPFCITGKSAEGVYDAVEKVFSDKRVLSMRDERTYRYGFINLMATPKYGSVEFRGMYGTLDVIVLKEWLSMLLTLKEYCQQFGSPLDIIKHIDKKGIIPFIDGLLRKEFRYLGEMGEIVDAYDVLRTIVLTVDSWEDVKARKVPEVKAHKAGDNPFLAALGQVDVPHAVPGEWVHIGVDGAVRV